MARTHRSILLALMLFIPCATAFPQVVETGSLRAFILGHEPGAAYDNWISHTVEGVAEEGGYNDYMPNVFDPQTNGFGRFDLIRDNEEEQARATWTAIFSDVYNDSLAEAQALIDSAGYPYDVVRFHDTETGRTYRMLRERLDSTYVDTGAVAGPEDDVVGSFHCGWGLFVLNPDASLAPVQIQVVHPNDDFLAPPVAVHLFISGDLGALAINGTGREVLWEGSSYANSRSLSDPSRNGNLPLAFFSDFYAHRVREDGQRDLTIQMHSFDTASHPHVKSIQVSCGPADGIPNRPSRDYSSLALDWVNFTPSVVVPQGTFSPDQATVNAWDYYAVWHATGLIHQESGMPISASVSLPGTSDNVEMMAVMEGMNPLESHDRFLHVEMDELPDPLEDAGLDEFAFYSGNIPPDQQNWTSPLLYYGPAVEALVAYLDNDYLTPDVTAPPVPADFRATYTSDHFIDFAWSPAFDPNFGTYRLICTSPPGVDSTLFTVDGDSVPSLVGSTTNHVRLFVPRPGDDIEVRLQAIDIYDNRSHPTLPVTATALDSSSPVIDTTETVTHFPAGAWPPFLACQVTSMEPMSLARVWMQVNGGRPLMTLLQPASEFRENIPVTYEIERDRTTPNRVAAGDTVRYYFEVGEASILPHRVREPADSPHVLVVTPGSDIFNAGLEQNDGGLVGGGTDLWEYGVVTDGPGGGVNDDHAWACLGPEAGTNATLSLPAPLYLAGHKSVYLVFQQWYQNAATNISSRMLSGGRVEFSTDAGDTWGVLQPIGGYPSRVQLPNGYWYPAFGGDSGGWQRAVFRLTNYIDDPDLRLRLAFYSSDGDSTGHGWVVDNIQVTPFAPKLPSPTNLTVTLLGASSIRLSWTGNHADAYRIYRGPSPYGHMDLVGQTSSTVWTDTSILASGEEHLYYRVTAVLR